MVGRVKVRFKFPPPKIYGLFLSITLDLEFKWGMTWFTKKNQMISTYYNSSLYHSAFNSSGSRLVTLLGDVRYTLPSTEFLLICDLRMSLHG